MSYFTEISDYQTYQGESADFHFNYNANTGGGQSRLGGKYYDADGQLSAPIKLNGRTAVFRFSCNGKDIFLDDDTTKYEIKPRFAGDNNMKFGVGSNVAPSRAIAAFLMLPETCGVKKSSDTSLTPLCRKNSWLQSMWLTVDTSKDGIAILQPKDCVFCGGLGEHGGVVRSFTVDFERRISDLLLVKKSGKTFEAEIASFVDLFAKIYAGEEPFNFEKCSSAIAEVMAFLADRYPGEYSGLMDPLPFIVKLAGVKTEEKSDAKKDLLSVALKVFAEKRGGEWLEEGREVNARVREWFGEMTEEKIAAFDDAKIAEMFVGVRDADGKIAFNPMWSGTTGQGWGNIKPETPEQTKEIVQFLLRLRKDASVAALFLDKGFERPKGFGPAVVSELLMKFHPETCFKHGGVTRDVLKTLGLATFAADAGNNFTSDEYKEVCGVAAQIRAKMQAMKLPRSVASDGAGDGQPPDYLTVNEFVWFVSKYQKEIENEVMKMKLKTPTHEIKAGKMTLKEVLAKSDTDGAHNDLMTRLVAALLTKPFAILSGVSGTGKSRMVRKLAYMTCNSQELQPDATEKPIGNFCMVQVKPNWHDSSDLLGYRSAISDGKYVSTDFVRFVLKAHAFPETPFFVCLDEMNLAPVEHYFAEFLSASESGRGKGEDYVTDPIVNPGDFAHDVANLDPQEYAIDDERRKMIEKIGLYLPSNLFVVGTVNMDDTTGGFSRKVLDRAMTIEMNEVKFAELKKNGELNIDELLLSQEEIAKFLEKREVEENDLDDAFAKLLEEIRKDLAATPLAFAYRFARECLLYRKALAALFPEEMGWKDGATEKEKDEKRKVQSDFALDHLFLMKILPRLVGSTESCGEFLTKLKTMLDGFGEKHRLSAEKLEKMIDAAKMNGEYLSYWL